jgi:hypothetical protein
LRSIVASVDLLCNDQTLDAADRCCMRRPKTTFNEYGYYVSGRACGAR